MIEMDSDEIKKLKDMLDSGSITPEVYEEIMSRWTSSGNSHESGSAKTDSGDGQIRKRGEAIRVSGSSSLSEVFAKELKVSGSSRIEGNCDADYIHISGSTSVGGDVISADAMEISGSIRVAGKITGKNISSSGSMHASGIQCEDLHCSGSLHIPGKIIAESAGFSGNCEASDVEIDNLESSGSMRAETILSKQMIIHATIRSERVVCRDIEIELYNSGSRIKDLEAETIYITPKARLFSKGEIRIENIKCVKGNFDGLRASRVTGEELHFGSNCSIEYAEAKKITMEDGAIIREKKIVD
ncbi:MAG: bactofilin family protein [Thermoplasmataceae archaeon]